MIDEELTLEQLQSFLKLDITVGWELAYPPKIIYDGPREIGHSNPPQIFFIEYKGVKFEISEEQYIDALERLEWIRGLRG